MREDDVQDQEDNLSEVLTEVVEYLTKVPEGATRQKLFSESSAENMFVVSKALGILIEAKEVVNLSKSALGPYMLVSKVPAAAPALYLSEVSVSEGVRGKVKVTGKVHRTLPPTLPAEELKERQHVFSKTGSLSPRTALGVIAYALYLIHLDKPRMFVTYEYVIDRIPAEVVSNYKGVRVGRAVVFKTLDEKGYGERNLDPNKPRHPLIRWDPLRFGYPFHNKDIKGWRTEGETEGVASLPKEEPALSPMEQVPDPVFADESPSMFVDLMPKITVSERQPQTTLKVVDLDAQARLAALARGMSDDFQSMAALLSQFADETEKALG